MRRLFFALAASFFLLSAPGFSFGQSLSLQQAYDLARQHYPLLVQKGLIEQTTALSIDNIRKRWFPQLSFNGQATYQSDVTAVDISFPGVNIIPPDKDQYKLTADISQLVYDGGMTREQKALQQFSATVAGQQVELDLYRLKERINELFLGALFLDEQIKLSGLIKQDILTGIKTVGALTQHGAAFRSDLQALQAEAIRADQRLTELRAAKKALMDMLGLLVNRDLPEDGSLEIPVPVEDIDGEISRPEIKLFSDQSALLGQQLRIIRARTLPKTSLFVQGGYGRPGLNMLKNEFDLFYIGGIRFNWSLGELYTQKNDRRLVTVNRHTIDVQKQTFLLNTRLQLVQQRAEIDKLSQLIASDSLILALRESIKAAAMARLENGVITANDYLREINAEDQSRQNLAMHQIQLLQARIHYQTISGN